MVFDGQLVNILNIFIKKDPVVCIPSSFFIGENGIPLEVVAGSMSAEELTKRILKVKQVWFVDC